MSETKHQFIHCDVPHCTDYFMGEPDEVASVLRKRIATLKYGGWVSRPIPQTESQKRVGIVPTGKEDFCPFHAFRIKED